MPSLPFLLFHGLAFARPASSAELAFLRHLWRKKDEERSEDRERAGGRKEIAETLEIEDNFEGLKRGDAFLNSQKLKSHLIRGLHISRRIESKLLCLIRRTNLERCDSSKSDGYLTDATAGWTRI